MLYIGYTLKWPKKSTSWNRALGPQDTLSGLLHAYFAIYNAFWLGSAHISERMEYRSGWQENHNVCTVMPGADPMTRLCDWAYRELVAWLYGRVFGCVGLLGPCSNGCRVAFVILHSGHTPVMAGGLVPTGHSVVIWLCGLSYVKPTGLFWTLGGSFVVCLCCVYAIFAVYLARACTPGVYIAAPRGKV